MDLFRLVEDTSKAPLFGGSQPGEPGGLWVYEQCGYGWKTDNGDAGMLYGPGREKAASLAILAAVTVVARAFDQDEARFTAGLPQLLADLDDDPTGVDEHNVRRGGQSHFPEWIRVDSEIFKLSALPHRIPMRESAPDEDKAATLEHRIVERMRKDDQTSYWVPYVFACLMFPLKNRSAACAFAFGSPVFEELREWERHCGGRPAKIARDFVGKFNRPSGNVDRVKDVEANQLNGLRQFSLFDGITLAWDHAKEARDPYGCGTSDEKVLHKDLAEYFGDNYAPPGSTTVCRSPDATAKFDQLWLEAIQAAEPKLPNLTLTDGRAPVWEVPKPETAHRDHPTGSVIFDSLYKKTQVRDRRVFVGLAAYCNNVLFNVFRGSELDATWCDRDTDLPGGWCPTEDPDEAAHNRIGGTLVNTPIIRHASGRTRDMSTSVVFVSMREAVTRDVRFLVVAQSKQDYNNSRKGKRSRE